MAKLFANSGDPDQTPCSAASDLGLHCLPITLLRVSRLQWVKETKQKKKLKLSSAAVVVSTLRFNPSSAEPGALLLQTV